MIGSLFSSSQPAIFRAIWTCESQGAEPSKKVLRRMIFLADP